MRQVEGQYESILGERVWRDGEEVSPRITVMTSNRAGQGRAGLVWVCGL